jgi:hypothetical protein
MALPSFLETTVVAEKVTLALATPQQFSSCLRLTEAVAAPTLPVLRLHDARIALLAQHDGPSFEIDVRYHDSTPLAYHLSHRTSQERHTSLEVPDTRSESRPVRVDESRSKLRWKQKQEHRDKKHKGEQK